MSHPSLSQTVLLVFSIIMVAAALNDVNGQTTTYHLHKDTSTGVLNQLKTAGPDAATAAVTSNNLKNLATGEHLIKAFETLSNVPNVSGVIPSGSTVTFTLWLKKTASVGTMFPRAKLNLNSAGGASLCSTTGATALTTTLTSYTLNCTTASNISMITTDRFYLWVGVNLTATGGSNFMGSLNVEGTLNGNYDSRIVVPLPIPPPSISSLSATSGPVGTSITVNGANFGSTQGSSTLKFNGVTATSSSWNATSIVAPVPSAATTGPVVVTVQGVPSNSVTFTVTPKINTLSPNSGAVGTSVTISGTTFGATQGTSTVTFNGTAASPTSWSTTSIAVPVPTNATTGSVVVTVNGQASNGVTFAVAPKIDSLSPTSGPAATSVTISGTTFGATQGTSTVTFNGTSATPTSWSATSIAVPVPAGGTTGPVVVTVGGAPSNGLTFTVPTTGTISGRVTAGDGTTAIPGATVKALQGTTTIATTSTNGTGDYALTPLNAGAYTIAVSATGYGNKSRSAVSVIGGGTSTVNLSLDAIVSGPVRYIYDSLGRLKATVGPIDTIVYDYDAVGNLLSIARQSSSQVSIIQFTPGSGPLGTTVTISGTGFSATPSQNTVTFNGVAATVTSATVTQLVVTVPAGATTGPITVTSPSGAATSSTSFTVGASSSGAPAITGFTPTIGPAGTAVTIDGSNFETVKTNNKVKFNLTRAGVTSASATSMVSSAPNGSSGRILVTTPYGSGSSAADFYLTPSPYVAADVVVTERMNLGESRTVSIPTANKVGMLIFDGTAGQRVSFKMSSVTFSNSNVTIYKPDGTTLAIAAVTTAGNFIEPQTLPLSGTYTILVDPTGSATGSMLINLYNVSDLTGSVVMGGSSVPVNLATPGQNGTVTFEGTAGQKVSLSLTSVSFTQLWVYVNNPDGSTLASRQMHGVYGDDMIGTLVLPASGTYSILVNPSSSYTGNITLTLNDASDINGTITANGTLTVQSVTTPGKSLYLSFTGTAGQRVAQHITGISYNNSYLQGTSYQGGNISIINPDSSTLTSVNFTSSNIYVNAATLPANGTYKVLIDPHHANTGNVTFALYDVPADFTATVQINDPAINLPLSSVGQHAQISFAGTAGQQTTVRITNNDIIGVRVSLIAPDGSTVYMTNFGADYALNLPMPSLPVTGTYIVLIDPYIGRTGSMDLRVTIP